MLGPLAIFWGIWGIDTCNGAVETTRLLRGVVVLIRILPDQANLISSCKIFASRGRSTHSLEVDMSVQSQTKRPKKRRNNNLKADVVMSLFLHGTLAIRSLTKRIQELDQRLAREFVSFNRISESIENDNNKIGDLLLEPIVRTKRLEEVRSQQQRDIARSFETEEQITRLLEARSDAISDLARGQHKLGKVR